MPPISCIAYGSFVVRRLHKVGCKNAENEAATLFRTWQRRCGQNGSGKKKSCDRVSAADILKDWVEQQRVLYIYIYEYLEDLILGLVFRYFWTLIGADSRLSCAALRQSKSIANLE